MPFKGLSPRGTARLLLALVFTSAGIGASLAAQYEHPSSFTARSVLSPSLLTSPYYTVDNHVGIEDYQYLFTVNTQWGTFHIKGTTLLRVRAREMEATAKLQQVNGARRSLTRRAARR
jgi:hypothetical protein